MEKTISKLTNKIAKAEERIEDAQNVLDCAQNNLEKLKRNQYKRNFRKRRKEYRKYLINEKPFDRSIRKMQEGMAQRMFQDIVSESMFRKPADFNGIEKTIKMPRVK